MKGDIMNKNISIIENQDGVKIVVINNIIFKGKQNIKWKEVEKYLKQYVKKHYMILNTNELIYIGTEFPDEFTGSKYTKKLKGALAKAKANLVQGIPELINSAIGKRYSENKKVKHRNDAKYGWYRYNLKFALPVYNNKNEKIKVNIYNAELLVRHAQDRKLYLYDIINIKKETSKPLESQTVR